ncbi:HEPN domain-containing protein [Neomoorella thermoacetica]|uniref:HEPN domain-containing protein n=1 Tax=Neomoorella thermoacetica TaxID=1525 RepID=UPI00090835DB|nr:HEPN domain-containing protein [Moorella thermoacetica]APC08609.1 HEPN domain protein [Moorella thermoacetica]
MNSREREQDALKWQDRARRDRFYDKEPEFDLACYLSQQCAEKSLKAFLIRLGIRFAYKHDLDYLVGLLPPEDQEKFYNTRLEWLSGWVTEGRYPGDAAGATREDAQNAIEIAEAIYNNVSKALRSE